MKLGTYHLQLLGTHPAHQRKGVATALTKFAEDKVSLPAPLPLTPLSAISRAWNVLTAWFLKARAARAPTTLETVGDLNFSIYKKMDYEVAGSGPISAWAPGASFTMFVFIKHTEKEQ